MMKKLKKIDIMIMLIVVYAAVSACMNMYSVKPLSFGLDFIVMDAGLFISWIPFLISSIITECYGKDIAKKIVITTSISIFILSVIACIESYIPTLPEYTEQAIHFKYVFNSGPRIIIASTIAFILGGVINIDIIASKNTKKTFSFFIKIFFAGLIGQFIDNITFEVLAFAPFGISLFEMEWKDVISATIWSTIVEIFFESICIVPLAKPVIAFIKKCE